MSSVLRLKPGTVVGGDYKISSLIAKGGMGAVYLAEQLSTECERALKVMHPELLNDAKARERFKQEARICSRIESDHVVKVIGSGIDEALGAPWLAMELIKGDDLAVYIKERGPLPRADVLEMFRQLCHGLGAAHRMGVVHRDLKLQNILVAPSRSADSPFTVKVLDFGISKVLKDDAASDTTAAVGSPIWMAPEQAQKGKLGAATDIWPLGLIAFRLLTGFNYWKAANKPHPPIKEILYEVLVTPLLPPSERVREYGGPPLPKGFDAWFARAVVRNPSDRYKDATEALTALIPVLSHDDDEAPARPKDLHDRETETEPVAAKKGDAVPSARPTPNKLALTVAPPADPAAASSGPRHPRKGDDPAYELAQARGSGLGWELGNPRAEASPDTSGGHLSTTGGVSIPAVAPEAPVAQRPHTGSVVYVGGGVLVGLLCGAAWLAYSHLHPVEPITPPAPHTAVAPTPPPPSPNAPAPALSHVTALAAGGGTACALAQREVLCWGSDSAGQLGDGATTDQPHPTAVRGVTGAEAVAVGGEFACARLPGGAAKCWGANDGGQLGDGTTEARREAVAVAGLHDVAQLALGARHGCARTTAGAVWCWGQNAFGQIGDGTRTAHPTPVHVAGVTDAVDVAARDNHTCAAMRNGDVRCWGQNAHGELGDGTATDRAVPTLAVGLSGTARVSLGARHACALTRDGRVRCWGSNAHGELGDASTTGRPHAADVPGLSGVTELSLGGAHSCARLGSGEVRCWGANNRGQLADGTTTEHARPEAALRGVHAVAIGTGAEHTCVITDGGEVRCAGRNEHGELGHGSTDDSPTPVAVRGR